MAVGRDSRNQDNRHGIREQREKCTASTWIRGWLFVAGHEARGEDGGIAHAGDIRAQVALTFRRLRETLDRAGFVLADVVQIRLFTVDLPAPTANYDAVTAELAAGDCRPTSLLAGVDALSDPAMLVEIDAVAAR